MEFVALSVAFAAQKRDKQESKQRDECRRLGFTEEINSATRLKECGQLHSTRLDSNRLHDESFIKLAFDL